MRRQIFPFLIAILAILCSRCAQIAPLTGGARDTAPPALEQTIPPSGTVSFTATEIVFRFNEYVQLKDLSNQLVISPRVIEQPEVIAEGKTVRVKLNQGTLEPNTTYRIDFGKAVADMNESNSVPSLSYVFSTGTHLDSLVLQGTVMTASNNLAAADVVVGLYYLSDTLREGEKDSLPLLVKPRYSAKTGGTGSFGFSNLPRSEFIMFAFSDANRNSLYDPVAERVAFVAGQVSLPSDTLLQLRLFSEEPPKQFIKRAFSGTPGKATLIYNKEADFSVRTLNAESDMHIYELQRGITKDTIDVLYKGIGDTLILRVRHEADNKIDTVRIALPVQKGKRRGHVFSLSGAPQRFDPSQPLLLQFQQWMDTTRINRESLQLRSPDDSLIGSRNWVLSWRNVHTLALLGDWHRGSTYFVRADTGMVYGVDGIPNDSSRFSFRISGPEDVSRLTVNLLVDRKQAYLVQLLNSSDRVAASRAFAVPISSTNRVPVTFDGVAPGTYRLKVIYDDNANGRWDTGNLIRRMHPEKVFTPAKQFTLLADWDVEEEVEMKPSQNE